MRSESSELKTFSEFAKVPVKEKFCYFFGEFGSQSIIYYLVLQVVIWRGIDTDLLKLLSALVVAVFLAIPVWKSRYFSKPIKKGGKN